MNIHRLFAIAVSCTPLWSSFAQQASPDTLTLTRETTVSVELNGKGASPRTPIPEEFQGLQKDADALAASVDTALADVRSALTEKNKEELKLALESLIAGISDSISKIEGKLEPEAYKTMERAQEKARDLKSKAAKPSLTPELREKWLKLADEYVFRSTSGVEVIKRMQDTRVSLAKDLQRASDEKDVIIEEIELLGFDKTLDSLRSVVDNMSNVSLKIRGMVSGTGSAPPTPVTPPSAQ